MMRTGFLLCVVLLAFGCDNPVSDVGLDLLEEGVEPETHRLAPTVFQQQALNDVTGAVPRVLAGRVEDPLFGTISVDGFIDFAGGWPASNSSIIEEVELQLRPDYVYGDTTADVTLGLYAVEESWTAIGARADTSFALGEMVTTFTHRAGDTTLAVLMPQAWIDDNLETIRHARFDSLFNGFGLKTLSAEAVVGFSGDRSRLLVRTDGDSVAYRASLTLSHIVRETDPAPSNGHRPVQDGAGPSVRLDFDLDAFEDRPLNGAMVRVFADTVASRVAPANFVRPLVDRLQLVKVTGPTDPVVLLAEARRTADADFRFKGAALRSFFQNVLFGSESYERLELRVPYLENSVNSVLLHDGSGEKGGPEAVLVVSK